MVITIDGPSGSGKSTISKQYAKKFGFVYVNSGAFYRTVSYLGMKYNDINEDNLFPNHVLDKYIFSIIPRLNWVDDTMHAPYCENNIYTDLILNKELFNEEIDSIAPIISTQQPIRIAINDRIRAICKSKGKWIIEGRDAGTIIMPETPYKFYLDASLEERAKRRSMQYNTKNIDKILHAVQKRDKIDQNKGEASLKKLDTYYYIDTTNYTIDEIIDKVYNIVNKKKENN